MLSENGALILKNNEIENTFNDSFGSIVKNLGLDYWDDHSLLFLIKWYKNHLSIKNIKAKFESFCSFSFQAVFMEEVITVDMKRYEK